MPVLWTRARRGRQCSGSSPIPCAAAGWAAASPTNTAQALNIKTAVGNTRPRTPIGTNIGISARANSGALERNNQSGQFQKNSRREWFQATRLNRATAPPTPQTIQPSMTVKTVTPAEASGGSLTPDARNPPFGWRVFTAQCRGTTRSWRPRTRSLPRGRPNSRPQHPDAKPAAKIRGRVARHGPRENAIRASPIRSNSSSR